MLKELDCRGKACPEPVIMTKKALEDMASGVLLTTVDNSIARDNVLRLAKSLSLSAEVREVDGNYQISIDKTSGGYLPDVEAMFDQPLQEEGEYVLLIRGATLGRGSDELGAMLMKSLLFTVVNQQHLPQGVLFLNSAVNLTCEGSPVLETLNSLKDKQVEIISCGTCLDYYNLKDKVAVGIIGNMYDIFNYLAKYRVISV